MLPPILVPLLIFLVMDDEVPEYRSSATIWVQEPAGINVDTLGSDIRFGTPAGVQQRVLTELLRTRSFQEAVALDAELIEETTEPLTDLESTRREAIMASVGRSINVRARGNNLLEMSSTTPNPALSVGLVQSAVIQYDRQVREEIATRLDTSLAYYSEQLELAQTELGDRTARLDGYVAVNPGVEEDRDREYNNLLARVIAQQGLVASLEDSMQAAYLENASATGAFEARFRMLDAPTLPSEPLPTSRTLEIGLPMAGFGVGVLLAAAYLYVRFWLDHTVRSSEDLEKSGVAALGYLPELNARQNQSLRSWIAALFRREPDFARRVAARIVLTGREGTEQ